MLAAREMSTKRRAMFWDLRRAAIIGLIAIGVAAVGNYLFGQIAQQSEFWTRCLNEKKAFSPDEIIEACTAVIASNKLTTSLLANARRSRGVAYQAKGDFDHAIADYNEAILLDPKSVSAFFNRGMSYRAK